MTSKKLMGAAVTAALLLTGAQAGAENLIINGDFEDGNTGFQSDYTYILENVGTSSSCPAVSMYAPGAYTVGTDPRNYHTAWTSFGDNTTGSGNMLIVNAKVQPCPGIGDDVWRQSVSLTAGVEYEFSYFIRLAFSGAPPLLQVNVNGAEIGTFDAAGGNSSTAAWTKVTHKFTALATGSVDVTIVDLRPVFSGDDYALDDLALASLTIPVKINVHPNSDPNPLNLASGGTTPVAILGSATFDVTDIDLETLVLGSASVKVVGKKDPRSLCSYEDIGSYDVEAFDKLGGPDGYTDLVCHFVTSDIAPTIDGEAVTVRVAGMLLDGITAFEGTDVVKVVKY